MHNFPEKLSEHLKSGATTLCHCWKVRRNDGLILGFTDHDRELVFDDVYFMPESGMDASDAVASLGLSVDTSEVFGVLRSSAIKEDDILAGLFDGAYVETWLINWSASDERALMQVSHIGEIHRIDGAFKAELRGLAHELDAQKGRYFTHDCDADLGDTRCRVNLSLSAFTAQGQVLKAENMQTLTASRLENYQPGWFTHGLLTWDSGLNQGRSMEVRDHGKTSAGAWIDLWRPMTSKIEAGDQFSIQAGCDKSFHICQARFANGANYRGFPHMPGNDFVFTYPNSDDDRLDGGSMNR